MLFKTKKLTPPVLITAAIILAAVFTSLLKKTCLDSLRFPLAFFSDINSEIQGIVFYHHNLVQNRRLRKETDLLRRQLCEKQELYFENFRLRELLEFKERQAYPLVAANVIGYDPSNLSAVIVIDKGKQTEIKQGAAVIANNGLLGRVIETGNSTSKVLLINDVNSGVAILIQRSRGRGLVSGTLTGSLILHYLSLKVDIKVGDKVITSGLGDLYPEGVLVGEVSKIQERREGGEIIAIIEPSADLSNLEEVLVVLKE